MRLEQINERVETGAYVSSLPQARRIWPDAVTFREAIQHPASALGEQGLRTAAVSLDRMGMPLSYSGRFAIVFRLTTGGGEKWAFRCFTSPGEDGTGQARAKRYQTIEQYTAKYPNTFVPFRYVESGIKVGREWYPSLVMRWAPGQPLGKWVEEHLQDPEALLTLCGALSGLLERLENAGIAHGDWQHDNLIVTDGGRQVTLVDYDGMFVPEFAGQPCPEGGHPNYQHPARMDSHFGPGLDRFACLAIETALLALSRQPALWSQFSDGESILFKHHDFLDPQSSPAFAAVRKAATDHNDDLLAESLLRLEDACLAGADSTLLPAISASAPPPPIFSSTATTAEVMDVPVPLSGPKWWQIKEAAPASKVWWEEGAISTTKRPRRSYPVTTATTYRYAGRLQQPETLREEQAHLVRWRLGTLLFASFVLFSLYHWCFQGGYPPLYFLWVLNFATLGYNRWPRHEIVSELTNEIEKMENLLRERAARVQDLSGGVIPDHVTSAAFVTQRLRDTPIMKVTGDLNFSAPVVRKLQNAGIFDALSLKQNAHNPKLGLLPIDELSALERWYHDLEIKAAVEYESRTSALPGVHLEVDRLRQEIAEFERHTAALKKERELMPEVTFSAYLRRLGGLHGSSLTTGPSTAP